jgi:hypothetical protein
LNTSCYCSRRKPDIGTVTGPKLHRIHLIKNRENAT